MINWLASYPKSGNTWVRLFLEAYILDHEPNINQIVSTRADQLASNYNFGGFNIQDYPLEQQPLARGMMLLNMDKKYGEGFVNDVDGMFLPLIMKTHMANIVINDVSMIPKTITGKVIYLYRDPRKVVLSYSKHMEISIDDTISIMLDDNQASWEEGLSDRLPQHMASWNLNAYTYMTSKKLQVYAVKYEDLLADPEKNFTFILNSLDIVVDKDRVNRSIDRCSLDNLRKQEKDKGFVENPKEVYDFFGDKTKIELTTHQEERLVESCKPMIQELKYI